MFLGEVFVQSSGVMPKNSTTMLMVIMYISLVSEKLLSFRPIKRLLNNVPQESIKRVDPLKLREIALKGAIDDCDQGSVLSILGDMDGELDSEEPDHTKALLSSEFGKNHVSNNRQILGIVEQHWHKLSGVAQRRAINLFIKYRYFEPLQFVVSEGDASLALFTLEAVVVNQHLVGGEIALSIVANGVNHCHFDVWSRSYDLFLDMINSLYGSERVREVVTAIVSRTDRERAQHLFEVAHRYLDRADFDEVAEAALMSPDRSVRFQVLEFLASAGTTHARQSLMRAMGHSDLETQQYAAELWRSI